jgi:hypothetical protein
MWQTLNTHIGNIPRANVMVISGKLGFVPASTRAGPYEQRMTADKADTMIRDGVGVRQGQASPYEHTKDGGPYKGVIIAGAGEYRRVFNAYVTQLKELGVIANDAQVVAVRGGIGQQRGQLGEFLRQINSGPVEPGSVC